MDGQMRSSKMLYLQDFFLKALEVGEFSKTFLMLKPEKSGKEETKGKTALNSGCSSQYFYIIEYL